jgi:predicted nucleic acid-binding protein
MSEYLLDSSILIRYLRRLPGYHEMLRRMAVETSFMISAITRLEIVRGMREQEREVTYEMLDSLETIPVSSKIADAAGELIQSYRAKGIALGDADAIIAASAMHADAALVTTNARHFPMPELVIYQADEEGGLAPLQKIIV